MTFTNLSIKPKNSCAKDWLKKTFFLFFAMQLIKHHQMGKFQMFIGSRLIPSWDQQVVGVIPVLLLKMLLQYNKTNVTFSDNAFTFLSISDKCSQIVTHE